MPKKAGRVGGFASHYIGAAADDRSGLRYIIFNVDNGPVKNRNMPKRFIKDVKKYFVEKYLEM